MRRALTGVIVGLLGCGDDPAPDDRFGAPAGPVASSDSPSGTGGKLDDADKPDNPNGTGGPADPEGPAEPDVADDGSDSGNPCPIGELGCACTDEGRCKLGLRCEAGACDHCDHCDYCGNGACGPDEDCDVCPADCAPCSTCEDEASC